VARRQYGRAWRVALCTLVLLCLPALRMGVENYMHHLEYWATRVRVGITSSDANFGVLGPEPVRNLSLRAATGRLLVRTRSPQVRAASGWIATAAIVVLTTGITLALSRLRLHDDLEAIVAWASAGVLALLLSPITWRAHAVALLPGCYLLIRKWASDGRLHAPGIVGLSAVAVPSIFLARGIVGTTASTWSDQWSLTTAAMLCLVVGIAAWPSRPSA